MELVPNKIPRGRERPCEGGPLPDSPELREPSARGSPGAKESERGRPSGAAAGRLVLNLRGSEWTRMSGEDLRRRTGISPQMPQRPLGLSSFGRALFSHLRTNLPQKEYEDFVKRWNTRRKTRTISSRRSAEKSMNSGRRLREQAVRDPDLARRSPFEQGLLGTMKEGLPPGEYKAFVRRWDRMRTERARRSRSAQNG